MLWDGDRLIQEFKEDVSYTTIYEHNSFAPVARIICHSKIEPKEQTVQKEQIVPTELTVLHYHNDHLGTPNELTNNKGDVVWLADYEAWGNTAKVIYTEIHTQQIPISKDELQPIRFQGQTLDSETGLHYNRFRYYDNDVGMFISRDPIGLFGGNNVFKYAPNPTGWIDPFGLEADYRDTSQIWAVKRRSDAAMRDAENAYKNGEYVDATVFGALGFLNQGIYPIAAVGDGVAGLAGAVGDTAEMVERPLFDLQLACMSSGGGIYCRGPMLAKAPVTIVKHGSKHVRKALQKKCTKSRSAQKNGHEPDNDLFSNKPRGRPEYFPDTVYSGGLVKVNKADPDADKLAKRIGGESRVKFANDPDGKEFDTVSIKYIAETKPSNYTFNRRGRVQAKRAFKAARETGRDAYYHLNGNPHPSTVKKLKEYSKRYDVNLKIDTVPFE